MITKYLILLIYFSFGFKVNGQIEEAVGSPFEIGIASPDASKFILKDTLTKNDTVYHTFHIKNIGNGNLNLHNVKCNYGCKLIEFTKDSIKPGKFGEITVAVFYYNRFGPFKKVINFTCDGKFEFYQLFIEGYIEEE